MLIFNTNNLALGWIPIEIYDSFHEKTDLPKAEIAPEIIRLGFVVDENRDEISQIEFEKNTFLHNNQPDVVGYVIAPTLACNMHCSYCFENSVDDKLTMSIEDADEVVSFILKQLEDNNRAKKLWIRWFGGEPCLALDIIKYISHQLISFCKENDIFYSSMVVSNGALLTQKNAILLKEQCLVKRVQITIDGMDATYARIKGTNQQMFFKVIDNITEIHGIINVIIRINLSEENIDEVKELIYYLLKDKGLKDKIWIYLDRVRGFTFNNTDSVVSARKCEVFKQKLLWELADDGYVGSLLHYLPQRNLYSCTAMQMMSATIGPDCNLYRCDNCLGKPNLKIGTCLEGFYRNATDSMFVNNNYAENCKNCNLLPVCGGGCLEEILFEKRETCCEAIMIKLKTDIELYLTYQNSISENKEHDTCETRLRF